MRDTGREEKRGALERLDSNLNVDEEHSKNAKHFTSADSDCRDSAMCMLYVLGCGWVVALTRTGPCVRPCTMKTIATNNKFSRVSEVGSNSNQDLNSSQYSTSFKLDRDESRLENEHQEGRVAGRVRAGKVEGGRVGGAGDLTSDHTAAPAAACVAVAIIINTYQPIPLYLYFFLLSLLPS